MSASAQIHLRTPAATKNLLLRAAQLAGSGNLTDYVLRAAVERAHEDLMSQHTFALSKAQWQEFNRRLEARPRDLPRLRKLLRSADIFDRAAAPT